MIRMEIMKDKINPVKNQVKMRSYLNISISIILYVSLSVCMIIVGEYCEIIKSSKININVPALRGILTQLQMLVSVYLVLRENRTGYIVSSILNFYCLFYAIFFMISTSSLISLPGAISYLGVLLIITLIIKYQKNANAYVSKIESQNVILEESKDKLQHMAFFDSLTNLPNKKLFINRLEQNIYSAKEYGTQIGVLFLDLDAFKTINDTMGHSAGDTVLKEIANRLSSSLRNEGIISRFGGDEFLIQIVNIEKVENLHIITRKIIDLFQQPIAVQNIDFMITASIGVAIYPVDGEDPESLIKNADIAMYSAKNEGKNKYVFCSAKLKNEVVEKMKLTNKLYKALENNELYILYQPQIDVHTKEIIGFEALLRWNNKEYGEVSPTVFIPLAETTGMIKPIGLWVFENVCKQCTECREGLNRDYRISINLSIEQLKDTDFIREVKSIINSTNVVPENIQVEITESIAFNEEPFILQRINELKSIGISISIDDFGTGFSSLSRLRTFPIDLIKIDIEFVRGITTNSHKEKEIIKSIIQLAKNLRLEVLAEGVEEEDQYLFLKNENCDEIQGFYFYKPMLPEEIKTVIGYKNDV